MEDLNLSSNQNEMASPAFTTENVVIKEEVDIKEEFYEPDMEVEEVTMDPLLTAADIKPEPVDSMEAVECAESFWDESQSGEFADGNGSPSSHQSPYTPRQSYHCKFCPKTYKRLGAFTAHTKTHTESITKSCTESRPTGSSTGQDDERTLRCPRCMFATYTYAAMLTHHREKHPNEVQEREVLRAKSSESAVNCSTPAYDSSFQCGVCFRKLEDMNSFFSHRKLHEQSICGECGKMTTYNSIFHKLTHLGKALHPCLYCEKYFSQKSTLEMHEKIHSNEKCYTCADCREKFVWFSEFLNHKKIHSPEKDVLALAKKIKDSYSEGHTCRKCDQSFDNIIEYSKHIVSHEENSERVLNLRCHICDQSFTDVLVLLKHMKCHR